MGFFTAGTAKQTVSGALKGGETAPAIKSNVKLPKLKPSKVFKIRVPRDCKAGDQFRAELDGVDTILTVPDDFTHVKGTRVIHTVRGDDDQIIASTLPVVAGYEIVYSKPVVYGCVMAPNLAIGDLVQQAQDQLTSQAMLLDCNAVLGMQFSVTTDGKDKTPVIFAFGTPCVVLQSASMPAIAPAGAAAVVAKGESPTTQETDDEEDVEDVEDNGDEEEEDEESSEEEDDMGIEM